MATHVNNIPTRRAILAAVIAAPALAATASTVWATTTPDAAIEAAWQRRQAAYVAYNAIPPDYSPDAPSETPEEAKLWATVNESEDVIRSTTARTPRGAMLQLWCAMYHSVMNGDDDAALTRGDFAALDRMDEKLEWNARLVLAALRSLQTIEA